MPGQFAVGHLSFTPVATALLAPFRTIFTYRNLRDSLISFLRWEESTGRDADRTKDWKDLPDAPAKVLIFMQDLGAFYLNWCASIVGWISHAGIYRCGFEQLIGDYGPKPQREYLRDIFEFTGVSGPEPDWDVVLGRVIGARTMTWSGSRTDRNVFWDDEV